MMGDFGGGKFVNFFLQALNFFFYLGKVFGTGLLPFFLVGSEEGGEMDGFVKVFEVWLYLLPIFFN